MGKRGAKKLTNTQGGGPNLKSVLRHEHLKNLALWSSAGDTPIPSLASLLGRRLAADIETTGIAIDPDLVSCQRCETILKPGFNCNVRIEKVSSKQRKRTRCKKSSICLPQNNVVYHCNFCSHRNLKRGTAKGQMKEIYPFKPKAPRPSRPKINQEIQSNMLSSPVRPEKDQVEEIGVAITPKPMMLTLDRDKRIRKSKSKKPVEPQSVAEKTTVGGSNKRKRKPWTEEEEFDSSSSEGSRDKSESFEEGSESLEANLEAETSKKKKPQNTVVVKHSSEKERDEIKKKKKMKTTTGEHEVTKEKVKEATIVSEVFQPQG